MTDKENCWEFKSCGRHPGAAGTSELSVCPASTDASADGLNGGMNGGRICWAVAGTLCGGRVQGTFAEKELSCTTCSFFKKVRAEEGEGFLLLKPGQEYKRFKSPEGFRKVTIVEDDLQNIDPIKARDLIITSFYEAQKEAIAAVRERLHLKSSDEEIHQSMVQTLKQAFGDAGSGFDNPSKESLIEVVRILEKKAFARGMPADILEHNKKQIEKVISLLKE